MNKPNAEDKRKVLYFVTSVNTTGAYVGETATQVILRLPEGTVRAFAWRDVEPVTIKETE